MPQNPSSDHNAERSGATPKTPSEHSASAAAQPSSPKAVPGWQTVEFPNVINADVSQRQEQYKQAMAKKAAPSIRITPGGANPGQSAMPPSFPLPKKQSPEGLIQLIQAANQRNHELQNRIAELENTLEESRQALQFELDRPEETPADAPQTASHAETSQQVNYLLNQLEFAQQSNQRQEILAETLSNQLQESQKRVAELESECQRLQQIITTQTTQLQQHEAQCGDLKARLVRQQQYTLQFKSALEKCLEVPPPSYETAAEYLAVGYGQPFEEQPDNQGITDSSSMSPSLEMPSTSDTPLRETVLPQTTVPPSISSDSSERSESLTDAADATTAADATGISEINSASDERPDPAKLVEAFFPKVDQIKPWSAQKSDSLAAESASVAQSHSGEPADPEKSDSHAQHNGSDAFLSKFHNTLRELASTDLTQPVDDRPHPFSVTSEDSGAIAKEPTLDTSEISAPIETDLQNISAMDVHQVVDTNQETSVDQVGNATPATPQTSDGLMSTSNSSANSLASRPSDRSHDETDSSDGTESTPTVEISSSQPNSEAFPPQGKTPPSPWRSLMPPKLHLVKDDESTDLAASDSPEILLPGEARQPSTAEERSEDCERPPSNGSAQAADAGESAEKAPRQHTQGDPVWHDLAHLVHATTDDFIRANEARTFSVFAPTLQDTVPSLLEIFTPPEVDGFSNAEEGSVPLNLSIPDQEKTKPGQPIPDPWTRAPGSYLNTAQPSEKSVGIAPLSFQKAETAKPSNGLPEIPENASEVHKAQATPQEILNSPSETPPEAPRAAPQDVSQSTPNNPPKDVFLKMPPGTSPKESVPAIPPINSVEATESGISRQSEDVPPPKRPSLSTILLARPGIPAPPSAGTGGDNTATPSQFVGVSASEPSQEKTLSYPPSSNSRNPNWPSPLLYPASREKAEPQKDDKKPEKSGIDLPTFLR